MGKLLMVGTYGTDDPTRATMPFLITSGALDRDHEPMIALMGEAVYLMRDGVVDEVSGVGFPELRQFVDKAIANEVPFYI